MMDVLQRSLTTFLSFLGMRSVVLISGGMILNTHSLRGGGGVVVVVVVVVVVDVVLLSEVSLVERFFLELVEDSTLYSLHTYSMVAPGADFRNYDHETIWSGDIITQLTLSSTNNVLPSTVYICSSNSLDRDSA